MSALFLYTVGVLAVSSGAYVTAKHLLAPPEYVFDSPRRHLYVLLALFPLGYLIAALVPHIFGGLLEFLLAQAQSLGREGPLVGLLESVRAPSLIGNPTAADVLATVLFWFTAYAVVTVLRRLVDINRLLKVSRKRLNELL